MSGLTSVPLTSAVCQSTFLSSDKSVPLQPVPLGKKKNDFCVCVGGETANTAALGLNVISWFLPVPSSEVFHSAV